MWSKAKALDNTNVYARVADAIPDGLLATELVTAGYKWYESQYNTSAASQRSTNGKVFECLVIDALYHHGIHPIYHQATVVNVPNVIYDVLLFHPDRPVVLSCKTSLRERWKQADLEGLALRQVYRGARSILLTLNNEGYRIQENIAQSNVFGLDQSIVIDGKSTDFDDLLDDLKSERFVRASRILPVSGTLVR